VGQKKQGHKLMIIILSNLKFAVKWILNIPPHLAHVAMSAKQAINDNLQGSVATYLRCGGVVDNQIKKGLLLSV